MDVITPEELQEMEYMRQRMAGGDASDPVRQYLEARAGRLNKLAGDDALSGGIKTVGGLGMMAAGGTPGMIVGGGIGLNGIADLLMAVSKRHRGRATQEAADAFGNTGLPGRPPTMAEILMNGGG
jgi:hypothetical protein